MFDYSTAPNLEELEREEYCLEVAKERFEADFQARYADNAEPDWPAARPTPTSRPPIPPPAPPLYAAARKRKLKKDP